MVTMWDLRQCFGWQMWMRWHKSEEAGRNCLRARVGRSPVSKKQSVFHWSFCYWLNHTKKNGFEKKIICHPTHHDITSYQDIRVHIPVWQEKHSLLHSTFKEMMCFSRVGSLIEAVLRLCSWAEAKSYCTALPEPWNQMGLWSPRSTELSGNLYLS